MNQHRDYGDGGGRLPRESNKPGGRGGKRRVCLSLRVELRQDRQMIANLEDYTWLCNCFTGKFKQNIVHRYIFNIKSDGILIFFMYSGVLLLKEEVGSWFQMEADVDYDGELSIKSSKARKRSRQENMSRAASQVNTSVDG